MIQKYKKMASWSKRIQGIEFTLNSLQGLQTLQQWLNHSQDQNPQQTEHFDLSNDNHHNDKKKNFWQQTMGMFPGQTLDVVVTRAQGL